MSITRHYRQALPAAAADPVPIRLGGNLLVEAIHAANDAFIGALVGERRVPSCAGRLSAPLLRALQGLNRAERRRLAALPFTLFSMRFSDGDYWRDLIEQPTEGPHRPESGDTFCLTALFLAWHLVQTGPANAGIALGMSGEVASLYQWLPLSELDRLASLAESAIEPRWPAHSGFWLRLLAGARRTTSIDAARYFGLHLLAGECLPNTDVRLRA